MKKFYLSKKVLVSALVLFFFAANLSAQILYVKTDGNDSNDGSNWANAFATLTKALEEAQPGDEIWVAEGTYYPVDCNPCSSVERDESFVIDVDNIAIYGGFDGTETLLSERNWQENITVLSGDIGVMGDSTDNSRTILDISFVSGVIVDGFTITGAKNESESGGGLAVSNSSDLLLRNLFISNNFALNGGGLDNVGSTLTIEDCIFNNNFAVEDGGGIFFNSAGVSLIVNTVFQNNDANGEGGAVAFIGSELVNIHNCEFLNNSAVGGGAGLLGDSDIQLLNCYFYDNNAAEAGALLIVSGGDVEIKQCVFYQNFTVLDGAGSSLLIFQSDPTIVNSTFYDNYVLGENVGIFVEDASPVFINCILWENALEEIAGGTPTVEYSIVKDGFPGTGNIDADPLFDVGETVNLNLTACSPAIDAGNPDTTGLDLPALDFDGDPRLFNATGLPESRIDMGAYEFQGAAVPGRPNTFYVNVEVINPGDGSSWACALEDLQDALDIAQPGDSIWVATGVYFPTFNPSDREASFFLLNDVAIYGGFAGTETELSQRNIELNETILSGDINGSGDHDGNSYSVVNGSGVDQTALLDGFTITMGNADGSVGGDGAPSRAGAGIFINDGSPTLNNLKVQQNWASNTNNNGGGMHVNGLFSEPVISNSLFSENDGFFGGAIYLFDFGQLTINNCTIVGNTGGGIYTNFNTNLEISNSLFEGNSGGSALTARQNSTAYINHSSFIGNAGGQVGAVFNWDSQIYVESSIFSGNTADDWGGAVYNSGPSVFEARNSLFFGNSAGNEGGAIYRVNTTTVKLINSVISGNSAGILGGGISNPDNNGSIEIINSIVWNNRANNQTNTISASIFNINPVNTSISFSLIANSGGSGNWNSSIGVDLGDNIDLDPSFEEDIDLDNLPTSDGDLRLTDCSPAIDAGNPDTTGLNLPILDLDDNPRLFNATGSAEAIIDMGPYEFQSILSSSDILYVNAAALTSGNGTSWECAFTSLQDALAIAQAGDTIWVAAGTYLPTTDELDRNASFFLTNGVAIYGGFAGGETELSQRNIELNETILSGDINGTGDHDGNSYSVVNGSGVNNTAVLDGFTIRMGNADFPGPDTNLPERSGAGIYISNGSPSLNQLIVEENITLGGGNRGGGIYVNGNSAHPIIENSLIRNNQGSEGGGINVRGDGNLTILNSDILENTGGGIFLQQNVSLFISGCLLEGNTGRSALTVWQNSFAQIEHTSFIGNTGAFAGGAIYNWSSEILVTDCIFSGNTASSIAGAIYNGDPVSWGSPSFEARNSLFFGNVAVSLVGGAFYNLDDAEVRLINCVLSGNSAGGQGGGMHNTDDSNVELINTIVWNNRSSGQTNTTDASITNTGNAVSNISFSLIANSGGSGNWNSNVGTDLGDNIDLDPNFEEDIDLDNLPTSDGDLRLTDCSPAIDAGNPDTTGLNLPLLDLDDNPRLFNATGSAEAIIDMGAYEFQSTLPDSDIIYVNAALPTSGNGTSWECAFTSLQDALAFAQSGDTIWVAAGTYYPTTDDLDRDASFFLLDGVAIYGGFEGGETSLSQRDWESNETILSGDINGSGDHDGNSYTVVNGSSTNNSAVLDGFSVTMGNADFGTGGPYDLNRAGAGVFISNGSPNLRNLFIYDNTSVTSGGGMFLSNADMVLLDCYFANNTSTQNLGGGLGAINGTVHLINNVFYENYGSNGGAIGAAFGGLLTIEDCLIFDNDADQMGALYVTGRSSLIINTKMINNTANSSGAIRTGTQSGTVTMTIINSLIAGNTSNVHDSAIRSEGVDGATSVINLINSTITNNTTTNTTGNRGAVWLQPTAGLTHELNLTNTIISGNISGGNFLDVEGTASPGSSYNLIGMGSGLTNGINGNILGINDPFFEGVESNNYQLADCSPAIDAGTPDTTGLNLPAFDLGGETRIFNATGSPSGLIDIGAYEFQSMISSAEVIYVNADNPNPGTGISWECALNDLQEALSLADSGSVIWVAAGTYLPTSTTNRSISFQMKEGVAIYGGFEGVETELSQRDPEENVTILSGDIGVQGDSSDNSYQVVTAGGGVSNVILDGFTITLGNADGGGTNVQGAGMRVFGGASVTIENCKFVGNHADDRGAGMKVLSSIATIRNSIFQSNTADEGAGLLANTTSNVVVENTIFRSNVANVRGGGIFYNSSTGELRNCLFYANSALIEGGAVMMAVSSTLSMVNNTITNNSSPEGGGLRISGGSASISNSIFWGNDEEINQNAASVSISQSIVEGGISGTGIITSDPLFSDPEANDFTLQACSPAIDAGDNDALSASDSLDLAGNPRLFDATELGSPTVDMGAYEFQAVVPAAGNPNVIYVDASNASSGSGRSWACAFTDLQDALDVAEEGDTIWVAQGTYYPTVDSDRTISFQMKNGVVIYGGFTGIETLLSERDWEANVTTLSGDIDQSGNLTGNSYTVVNGSGTNSTAVIDGFTITMGNADVTTGPDSNPNRSGGGIYNNNGSPTIANCSITGNFADRSGAGIYNINSASPTLNNCVISNNTADDDGGGIYNENNSSPLISDCIITGNVGAGWGGGIRNENNSSPIITNSIISGNVAFIGGGILNWGESSPSIINTIISGNEADFLGGGIYNFSWSSPSIINSTISGNKADADGGGIYNELESNPIIINSIIWNNSANGLTSSVSASVWNELSNPQISYSLIANSGGSGGNWAGSLGMDNGNNIQFDPLFTEDIDLNSVPTSAGNLTLQACSPAIDAGDNDALSVSDSLDLAGNPRLFDATELGSPTVDLGAYEFQAVVPASGNQGIIYVNVGNSNSGNGGSWDCAFDNFNDALAVAQVGDTIWVAAGTYKPSAWPAGCTGCATDRDFTFLLKDGVSVYGGFAGTETMLSDRDIESNETILSGDIGTEGDESDNVYHVVLVAFDSANPTTHLDGFTITGGNADGGDDITVNGVTIERNRGGGIVISGGQSTLANNTITGNSASIDGGGIYTSGGQNTLTNNIIAGNSATFGGGIYTFQGTNTLTNNLVLGNSAGSWGGGIYTNTSTNTLTNNSISGNTASQGGGIQTAGGINTLTNNIIWGNNSGIFNSGSSLIVTYSIVQGGFAGTGNLDVDPLFIDQPPVGLGTAGDLRLQACSPAIDAGDNDALSAADSLDLDGNPRLFDATELGLPTADMGAYEYQILIPALGNTNTIYVNSTNTGSGSGRSWDCAFDNLQDALSVAQEGDTIWVAAGTYKPSAWPAGCTGCATDRDFTFLLKDGVSVYGGFAGTETMLSERDIESNETILSGDIGTEGDESDNVYHVVLVAFDSADPTTHLDGFTITGGNADELGTITVNNSTIFRNFGSGIYVEWGTNTFINNTVSDNMAEGYGGGIFARLGVNTLVNNTVVDNVAILDGGGIYTVSSTTNLATNSILGNSAERGGGLFLLGGENTLSGNSVSENLAETNGGGIFTEDGTNHLLLNTVSANTAQFGSGIYSREGVNTMTINLVLGNLASFNGGGIYTRDGMNTITNNTLSGNSANNGAGVYSQNSTDTLTNNIIWGNSNGLFNSGSTLTVTYSIVQGGFAGTGNLDLDPLFVDQPPVGLGTAGDLRLQTCSPAIDAGDNDALGVNDTMDLDGNPRFFDATEQGIARVDMGVYEFQTIASSGGNPNTIYVNINNAISGNGLNWGCAFTDIQNALAIANEGDTIWVAQGTYFPTSGIDRGISFELKNAVSVYGGFDGTEDNLEDRNWEANPTILSGNIGDPSMATDNSYHVLVGENLNLAAVLDGFIIREGYADGGGDDDNGGGLFLQNSHLNLSNLIFENHFAAANGGAIYSDNSHLILQNVALLDNSATDGAGIYLQESFIEMDSVEISENVAQERGGGIYSDSTEIEITNSKIKENQAMQEGGGFFKSKGEMMMKETEVKDNQAMKGGGGFQHKAKVAYEKSKFLRNTADNDGGGLYAEEGELRTKESQFEENTSGKDGGGMHSKKSKVEIEETDFMKNTAMNKGGGVKIAQPAPASTIDKSQFKENFAMEKGGGMSSDSCDMMITDTEFSENEAMKGGNIFKKESTSYYKNVKIEKGKAVKGGGMYLEKGAPILDSVEISENMALNEANYFMGLPSRNSRSFLDGEGGGIFGLDSRPQLINLTITNNFSDDRGGGFFADEGEMEFENTDLENNQSKEGGGGFGRKGRLVFENSRIKGNTADEDGGGIFSDDGELKTKESQIEDNTAGRDGGGIKSRQSKIEIEETEIMKNMAMREGGGIKNSSPKADSRIEKSMLKENMAMEKGGGMATDSCDMLVRETDFTENESKRGGNIFKKESTSEYEDVEITKGKAAEGGGVFMEKGAPRFSNVLISENQALKENNLFGGTQSRSGANFLDGKGGGIFGLDSRPQLINLTISNNFAEDQGGGLFADEGEMEFENTDLENNQSKEGGGGFGRKGRLVFENSRIKGNTADEDGGGIFSDDGELKTKESQIEDNTAGRDGGGIKSRRSKIEIEETEIMKNMAMREGGGIKNSSPKADSRIEKSMLKENMAMEKGGGMATDSCDMLVRETDFTENESKRGGNIFKKESTSEYEDVEISKGKASQGGGIFMDKGSPRFENVRIKENLALKENNLFGGTQARSGATFLDGQGGGIFGLDSRPQLINLTISNNFAEDQGGGFFAEEGEMEFDESVVENNESMEGGGGFSNSTEVNFMNSRLNNNSANSDGGGLFSTNGDLNFKNSEISNNSSGKDGGGVKTRESRIEFENVTIGGNTASQSGGGVKKVSPGPDSKFERVLVIGNSAGEKGGGLSSDSSNMQIANSIFASNEGKEGGNVYKKSGNGRYKNVRIQGGKAIRGGGIYMENCSTEMVNTQFTGNVALNESNFNGGGPPSNGSSFLEGQGGGMFNLDSRPQLINLTISGNFAEDSGGGMMNKDNSDADVRNTIVHNNQTGVITDSLESGIMNENSMPQFNNSIVQGSNGSDGWNPNAGQDNGNNFDFNPQFSNPLNPSPDPSLGGNFRLGGNSAAIDSGNTDDVPPDVETDIVGNNRRSEGGVDIGAYERQPCLFDETNTIYVNSNRSDSIGDGTSWATAFNLLFDALFYAADCDSTFFIYIAEGTYFPTDDPTDRHTSVILRDNLNIFGGFPGTGNPTLDDRDWRNHETILSGDINFSGNLEGNSFSVVAAYGTDTTASLSGVVIRNGNANGSNGFLLSPVRTGAGIYLANSGPRLNDIRLESNNADFGAGIALVGESSPEIDRIEFVNNTAQLMGGGLADYTSGSDSVLFSNMLFHGNTALMGGGGIFLENSRKSTLANLTLTENNSELGGGAIQNNNSNTHLINSILWNNSSEIVNGDSLLDVTFSIVAQDDGFYPGLGNLNVNPNFEDPGNKDFTLKDCSPAINAGDGTGLPTFDLLGNVRPANANFDLGSYEFQSTPGTICCPEGNVVFVNQNAVGFNNGSNWFNAFTDLQDALSLDCENVTEIWVAQGTYFPDRGTQSRDSSFVLRNGIRLIGGFIGTESEVSQRNWESNTTILSGDINQSDSLDGNSYSIITAIDTDLTAGIDGFLITMGNADGIGADSSSSRSGAGLYVFQGSISVENCRFEDNHAAFSGGGIFHFHSESEISNTVFSGNKAGEFGGAISNFFHSSPSILECTFNENEAEEGGAISNQFHSSPLITGCDFSENDALNGGAIFNNEHSSPGINRSTFRANVALEYGGALMSQNSSSPDIRNSLFSGNAAEYGGALAIWEESSPSIEGVTISGNLATEAGGGIFNGDGGNPIIRNSIIWNNLAQNSLEPIESSIKNMMLGNPEFFFSLIQYSGGSGLSWESGIGVDGGGNLDVDPEFVSVVNPSIAPTLDGNFLLTSCSPAINAGDTALVSEDGILDLAGNPRVNNDTIDIGSYEYFGPDCGLECPEGSVVYVVEGGSGAESGANWSNAIGSLQNALEIACKCLNIEEVWVASGTYYPDNGRLIASGDRNASFQLCNEVALLGGFTPGDTSLAQRNWVTNESILSGDINILNNPDDNSFTVVVASNTDSTAVIDGFTISGGRSNGTGGPATPDQSGAGVYCSNGSPTIINCHITENYADQNGGGIYLVNNSSPQITNSIFHNNIADNGGGAYTFNGAAPVFNNCIFSENTALFGGGMGNLDASPTVYNSRFSNNTATEDGGGVRNYSSTAVFVNCLFAGNGAINGAGIQNASNSDLQLINSTIVGNTATNLGGGLQNMDNSISTLSNSIVWGNTAIINGNQFQVDGGTTSLDFSAFRNEMGDVFGSLDIGVGNITSDPLFVDEANSDFNLQACSPALDIGSNELFAYSGSTDLEGNPRFVNSTGSVTDLIDLGAFEFQSTAVMPEINCNSMELFLDEAGEVSVLINELYNKLDSCGDFTLLSDSVSSYQFTCSDLGEIPFFIQVRDDVSLREDQCSGLLTVSDTLAPVLTCPVSDTVYVGPMCNVINKNYGSLIDIETNCPVSITQIPFWGQVLAPGQYTQTVTAVDVAGNIGTCNFSLFVLDTNSPIIECPEDQMLFVDENCTAETEDYSAGAIVSDNCGIMSVEQLPAAGMVLTVGDSVITTLTATDMSGNTSSCNFLVVVVDTIEPMLNCLETEVVRFVNESCTALLGDIRHLAVPSDNCIGSFEISQSEDFDLMLEGGQQIEVTINVAAETGWSAFCLVNVISIDTIAPVFSCDSSSVILYVDESCETSMPDFFGKVEVDDNCLPSSEFVFEQSILPGTALLAGSHIEVELTLSESGGWSESCTFELMVTDTTAPEIQCIDSTIVLTVGENCSIPIGDWTFLADAVDNCLEEGVFSVTQSVSSEFELGAEEEITLTLLVSEASGWTDSCQVLIAAVNLSEYIWLTELPENESLECGNAFEPISLITADFCDTLTVFPQIDSLFGCMGLEQLTVYWSFGVLEHTQIVTFSDEIAPEWLSPLPQDITVDCSDVPLPESLEAIDNCSEVEVSFVEEFLPGNSASEYYLNRQWIASDDCNNSISHTQVITVTDAIPPTSTCPPTQFVDAGGMCSITLPDFTALVVVEDNCSSEEDLNINQIPTPGLTLVVDEISIFMTVFDQAGNSSNCSFNLVVSNFGEDVSLSCPDSLHVNAIPGFCEAMVSLSATFTEDCDGVEVVNDFSLNGANADGIYPLGITQVEFNLFQNGDSVLSCVTVVSVPDIQVPEISCPEDLTLQVDPGSCAVFDPELGQAEVELACAGFEISSNAPLEFETGFHTVVYTVLAENGQSASCEQTISVEDNQPPSIQCPENEEVILESGECELVGYQVEDAIATSFCGSVEVSNNAIEVFPIGITTIIQIASDINGQESSCTHTVSVAAAEESSILCPEDIQLVLSGGDCTVEDLLLGDAVVTGTCESFSIENNAPEVFEIGETTVTYLALSNEGTELSCSQTVSLINTDSPEISCPSNLFVNTDEGFCFASGIDPGDPIVSHSCYEVSWSYELPAQFSVGITIVEYIATAENDSTAVCQSTVEVVDIESPTIECPLDVTVEIPNGETEVALTIDPATGSDNCGLLGIENDFNGGENASGIYPLGLTTVVFTVEDINGNQNSCQTQVLVFEEGAPPVTVEISGNFASWAGVNINNVELQVTGDDPGNYFTNPSGDYLFDVIQGSNVIVTPKKDMNWLDGVSVTDLVLIQRHILGIELLSNPYKIIAADVSGSGSISTFDLVVLQMLIIGILDEISSNEPWLFVPGSYSFNNPENPLQESWPQIKAYQGINANLTNEDWVSMKVGDVSGDAGLSGQRILTEGVEFALKVEKGQDGKYELVVSTIDDEFLTGFQLEFEYNNYEAIFDRVDYSNNSILADSDIMTFRDWDLDIVRMVWFNGNGANFKAGEEVFRFVFSDLKKGADVNSLIKPVLRGSKWQPYLSSIGEPDRYFRAMWVDAPEERPFVLYQNRPNPFGNATDIRFELPEDGDVHIEILNSAGQLLHQNTVSGRQGLNVYQLQLEGTGAGIFYLRVTAGRDFGVKKMVRF